MENEFNYAKRALIKKAQQPFINQTELVYLLIKEDIVNSYRKLGSKVNQDQIAELLGVSRSPVRDAVNRLVEEGLLVRRGQRGYHVYIPTMKDVTYASEFRIAIEVNAIQLALKRVTEQDFERLRENMRRQEACPREDVEQAILLDLEFHKHLVACSKSDYLIRAYHLYDVQYRQIHNRIAGADMHDIRLAQHKNILFAFEQKDIIRLESSLRVHLTSSEDFMQAPEYFYE